MENGKLFELAVILAAPVIAAMNKSSPHYESLAAEEIGRCLRIVTAASKGAPG